MASGLEAIYADENVVYLLDSNGKPGSFKGFDGTKNKNVDAPYLVATGHTKEDWEDYNKQEAEEEADQEQEQKPGDNASNEEQND